MKKKQKTGHYLLIEITYVLSMYKYELVNYEQTLWVYSSAISKDAI